MLLRDLLKTIDGRTLVRVEHMSNPVITVRAGSWRWLDDGLLNAPVATFECCFDSERNNAATVRLRTAAPVFVSTVEELQTAMDDDSIHAVALANDIRADSDMSVTLIFNSAEVKSLDLNGYILAASNTESHDTIAAVRVMGGGTLNIYDSQECGEVFGGRYGNINHAVWVTENSMVNIYGGYFSAGTLADDGTGSSAVCVQSGAANIYGGILANYNYNGESRVVLDDNDGNGTITMYGGVTVEQDPADYLALGKHIMISFRYFDYLYQVVGK